MTLFAATPAAAMEYGPTTTSYYGDLKLDDGSRLTLLASAKKGRPGRIHVGIYDDIQRGFMGSDFLSIRTASVDNRSIVGPIGRVGRLDMGFQPTGPAKARRNKCFETDDRPGVLTGSFRLRLKGTHVDVSASRVQVTRSHWASRPCRINLSHSERASAVLTACGPDDSAYQARQERDGRTSLVAFSPYTRAQGLLSMSYGIRRMRPGAFTYSEDFSSATLRPPTPFSGTGTYADGRVSGDLEWRAPSGQEFSLDSDEASLGLNDRRACAAFSWTSYSPTATSHQGKPTRARAITP